MSSIYNTSRTIKGKNRAPVRRAGVPLNQQQQHMMPPPTEEPLKYQEFNLVSSVKRDMHHLMDFKSNKTVEPSKFARPVKLHRKESHFTPYRQYIQNLHNQRLKNQATNGASSSGTTPSESSSKGGNIEELSVSESGVPQPQQHGPKTGADTSLIAPMGGATRNKQMLFKKRTKQIYLAKEDTRELKEQEHRPWILEDYDGQNSFTGTLEGGQRSDYMFFVLSGDRFKVMPVDRWYKFQSKRNFKTLSLEEAEEQIKKQQKRENGRWMMLKREKDQADPAVEPSPKSKFKLVDNDERTKIDPDEADRHDSDIDDLDFDDVFQDDEEGAGEHEAEDEEVRDSKERVKKEIKEFSTGNQEGDEDELMEDSNRLTSEGKQMRKLVRELEKNRAYESDEEENPYASSDEEMDSEEEEEEGSEGENKDKKQAALKKKAVSNPIKPMMPKKAHTAKLKKEGLSRPIGRPGSPSLYMKKEGMSNKGAMNKSTSPIPRTSSPNSPSSKDLLKKRKIEDISSPSDGRVPDMKLKKVNAINDEDLITEEEVIEVLRGQRMTTKEFLMHFRKRIKKNYKNREIITGLLKKVARHNTSEDPRTRLLELKPELQ
ncbi:hypothetical protein BDB01DRAFT_770429 [Pilobolus umbonatus]|nr:hypothetical protein BDB01DRAFT_770429 [Pilobolus umbonatus]